MDNERFETSDEGIEIEEETKELNTEAQETGLDIALEARKLITQEFLEPIDKTLPTEVMFNDLSYDVLINNLLGLYPIYYDSSHIWWVWSAKEFKWVIQDEVDIVGFVKKLYDWSELNKTHIRNQFLYALKTISRLRKPEEPPLGWVQFKNTIIDIYNGEHVTPNSKYMFTNPLPWNFGKSIKTPLMDKLLKSWLNENYDIGYEIIAYCLYRDYPIQRLFAFVGAGSNGKGQFLSLLTKFLGLVNCTASDLDRLGAQRFEASKLFKKLLCEISEVNVNQISKTSIIKKLSGGDNLSCEFKRKDAFDFKNYAKIIIASNSLPMTRDRTDGFYRRWNILKFPNQFPDGKSVVDSIPDEEFENLCVKCVLILKEVLDRGGFSREGGIQDRKRAYENLSNPIKGFVDIFYVRDPQGHVVKHEFNDAFWHYLSDNGFRQLSRKEINDALRGLGYLVERIDLTGQLVKCVVGLRKRDAEKTVNTLLPTAGEGGSGVEVSTKILAFINSGAPGCDEEQNILEDVSREKDISWVLVRSVLREMAQDGVLAEVKAGIYRVV